MLTVCPGCGQHINENSAVMMQGGLVYHQRCSPGSRTWSASPKGIAAGIGKGAGWIARFYLWVISIVVACAFPPIGITMLIVFGVVRWVAWEFARAIKRS